MSLEGPFEWGFDPYRYLVGRNVSVSRIIYIVKYFLSIHVRVLMNTNTVAKGHHGSSAGMTRNCQNPLGGRVVRN